MILKKAGAFLKRDFIIASSYKLDFIMTTMNSLLILFLLFFIGKLTDPSSAVLLKYGDSFFSYVLIGYGFFQYFQLSLTIFSRSIQREQLTGCLEAMLGTQTSTQISIISLSLYSLLSSFLQLIIIFIAGVLFFNFSIIYMNIFATLIIFILSIFIFISFGIISAAFIIVLKKGDPLSWLIISLNFILGGAFFPVDLFPEWLQNIANFIPAKYALDALRLTILKGYSLSQVGSHVLILTLLCIVLFPISLLLLNLSVKKAKKDGTLVHY